MKNKILSFILFALIVPCAFLFTGCGRISYNSVVPTDSPCTIVLTRNEKGTYQGEQYDRDKVYSVYRTNETILGENRDVIYIEYSYIDNVDSSNNKTEKLLYVNSKSFYLDGEEWKKDEKTYTTKWSSVYGEMGKAETFVDYMTMGVRRTPFYDKYKTAETDEYIEYDFKENDRVYRISNDMYKILLYYTYKGDFEVNHQATLEMGKPSVTISYLDTLTEQMIA